MSVLIVGCGDLGTEIGLRLVQSGEEVIAWRRHITSLPHSFQSVVADLALTLPHIPQHVTSVIVSVAASHHTEAAYRLAHITGLTNLLTALDRDQVHPERVVLISSTTVYGGATGPVDEHTPPAPISFSSTITLEAESILHGHYANAPTRSTVLRLGGIYGPGRTRLIDLVANGTAVIPDTPRRTNRIHRDDAAAAAIHLLTLPHPAPVYLGVDNHPADLGDVYRFLAHELSCPVPATGTAPVSRGGDKHCSNALLRSSGFRFAYPSYIEGYRAVIAGLGVRHP